MTPSAQWDKPVSNRSRILPIQNSLPMLPPLQDYLLQKTLRLRRRFGHSKGERLGWRKNTLPRNENPSLCISKVKKRPPFVWCPDIICYGFMGTQPPKGFEGKPNPKRTGDCLKCSDKCSLHGSGSQPWVPVFG